MSKIDIFYFVSAISLAGLMVSCVAPDPPPFPPNSPADPNVRGVSNPARLIARDETTEEVERALASTEDEAKSAETMHHDMANMPEMAGMDHGAMQQGGESSSEKKKLAKEMQKNFRRNESDVRANKKGGANE